MKAEIFGVGGMLCLKEKNSEEDMFRMIVVLCLSGTMAYLRRHLLPDLKTGHILPQKFLHFILKQSLKREVGSDFNVVVF